MKALTFEEVPSISRSEGFTRVQVVTFVLQVQCVENLSRGLTGLLLGCSTILLAVVVEPTPVTPVLDKPQLAQLQQKPSCTRNHDYNALT